MATNLSLNEETQAGLVEEAAAFATLAHEGQKRKVGGQPYIVHPQRVVQILRDVGVTDWETLAAAWLHDVLEDTDAVLDLRFFPGVASVVRELTRNKRIHPDKNAYLVGFAHKSHKAVTIKLADRYDNLLEGSQTMGGPWIQKYCIGAGVLLKAAMDSGALKEGPAVLLFGKLKKLRDSLV